MTSRPLTRSTILVAAAVVGLLCCLSITCASDGGFTRHGWLLVGLTGSGTLRSENRDVAPFDAVQLRNALDVEIVIGPERRVSVEADDNLLTLIDTRVEGHRLVIDSHGSWNTRRHCVVHVQVPSLREVQLDGSGDASIDGFDGDALDLEVAGSGDITAHGRVGRLVAAVQGSGDLHLDTLTAQDARVRIAGSGDAAVRVAGELDAVVDGSGDIRYRGNPKRVRRRVNGSGSIESGTDD